MTPRSGTFRLFRIAGIDVFLHWSWFLVAAYELQPKFNPYHSQFWNIAEYLSLFLIVTLHEFGHALACRSVGGTANQIMLWPLGGIAYVNPPPRAGAYLWSIAAGPLVNVVLVPLTLLPAVFRHRLWPDASPDFLEYVFRVALVNGVLLVFNMLPIYPLDGGQVVRGLLWFVVGQARSLMIAASIGLLGAAGGMVFAASRGDNWLVVMAVFAAMRSWNGFRVARAQQAVLSLPRHTAATCTNCRESPLQGDYWGCPCGIRFDAFAHQAVCPNCQRRHERTACPFCGTASPLAAWYPSAFSVVPVARPAADTPTI